ncbi:hypothetical protein [Haloarcula halophila]|uniref:hypothetical protein n=1 Tax=Haloarcula TaxID=2237 RepID=UPI0023E3B2CA|nr:hypothetical protein [Halomicroarcula sp. DFY41]
MDIDYRTLALRLFFVGLLCLPAPLYLGYGAAAVGELTQNRVDNGYYADRGRSDVVADRRVIEYDSMPTAERRAIDRIVENSSGSEYGDYEPRLDNPIVDRETPFPVERNGTVYTIRQDGGTTLGLGFFGFIAGMGLAVVGVVLCVGSGIGYLVLRWRDATD